MICKRIAVLLACHNRRDKSVACLRALRAQASPILNFHFLMPDGIATQNPASSTSPFPIQNQTSNIQHQKTSVFIEVFLVDDGSSDGTPEAVHEAWPEAHILHGPGNLYWSRAMRLAWSEAGKSSPDHYLLLNDDTILAPFAVSDLLEVFSTQEASAPIVVASICDPDTGLPSYGGMTTWNGKQEPPTGAVVRYATFNCNCVLVPKDAYKRLGMFHPAYQHAMADTDYGLHANRMGIPVLGSTRYLGTCKRNPVSGTWRDTSLRRAKRLALLRSSKGLPPGPWITFCRRNLGPMWWFYVLSPYLRVLAGR
jgi:GT2 family glycosyltransferase